MGEVIRNWWQDVNLWAAGITVTWVDLLVSAVIVAVAVIFAFLFSKFMFQRLLRLFIIIGPDFDIRTMNEVKVPAAAMIVLIGLYASLVIHPLPEGVLSAVNKGTAVAAILIAAYMAQRVVAAALMWVQDYLGSNATTEPPDWILPVARRVAMVVIVAMALMLSLDILGVNISPLIAGLGIGGLAVALALQPTLSNLFAGTYVMTEDVVDPGDYIEMENGITGYVVDVNWRSTRLRTWGNNLVVIPNSRFAETIITNYSKPEENINVYLTCGVAYESDLQRVEAVSIEVMQKVEREHPGVVQDYGVYFGYDTFGESNVDFWLFMQAKNRLDSFEVRSELIKQLHARLTDEGITINYPVRTLHFPDGQAPPGGMPVPPGAATAPSPPTAAQQRGALPADTPGNGESPA